MNKKVYIIGHKNPDTDSIVSATAYARLKQLLGKSNYIAARAGKLAPQTEYIYKRFNVKPPRYIPDLIPKVDYYMNDKSLLVDENETLLKAVDKMITADAKVLPVVDKNGKYLSMLNYNAFAMNAFKILNPKREDLVLTSLKLIEKTLNATPIIEFDAEKYFTCTIMVGDDSIDSEKLLLAEHKSENLVVILGDREDIQKLCIDAKVRAIIVTKDYIISKEIKALAEKNKVSVLSSHDSTATTAMLTAYSSPVASMADNSVQPVHLGDTVQKIKPLLAQSPARCLPVVDGNNKVLGTISESDLLLEPNIQVILVDHNEPSQAVDGLEHFIIQEIIDHHRIGTLSTKYPITFINKPVGSTATLISALYRENRISIPKDIAALLLCGILSDTLILQSSTTTETDVYTAEYLSNITDLDIKFLGEDIIKSGSHIGGRSASEIINQDMKEYCEAQEKFTVSQIEVDSTVEILKRKKELLEELENERKSRGLLFSALLITDITTLSSIMFFAAKGEFEDFVHFPKQEDHVYFLKDVVSRKKQLIPLLTEIILKME